MRLPYYFPGRLMTLKQLRFLQEIARQSLNISAAAAALHISQPSVSRQLQLLEKELGVDLLVRHGNRIVALTEPARLILDAVNRLLIETDNIRHIAKDSRTAGGKLVIVTNPLHAHYTLPDPIKKFRERYPDVELHIVQGDSRDILNIVDANEADIGISTDSEECRSRLVYLPHSVVGLSVIVPHGHPLAQKPSPALQDLAAYPIVGYDARSRPGKDITQVFHMHGLTPKFVVSARSSDVIKTYVSEGLGIGIVSTLALKSAAEDNVHRIDASHLFPPRRNVLILRRDIYLRRHLLDLIRILAPQWTSDAVRAAVEASAIH